MFKKSLAKKVKNAVTHSGKLLQQGSAWATIVGIALVTAMSCNYKTITMYAQQAAGVSVFFHCEK